jgi:hypothetical protein
MFGKRIARQGISHYPVRESLCFCFAIFTTLHSLLKLTGTRVGTGIIKITLNRILAPSKAGTIARE